MIEVIRLLVDSLAKVVHYASANKEKRDLNKLGGQLYGVYIQLADILVLAGKILADLGSINEGISQSEMQTISSLIATKLARQARNLQAVTRGMSAVDRELIVLNAGCRIKLDGLLRDKHSLINAVIGGLTADNVPLGALTEQAYTDLLAEIENGARIGKHCILFSSNHTNSVLYKARRAVMDSRRVSCLC